MADQWCSIADVRDKLPQGSDAIWDDPAVTAKIEAATSRLSGLFCTTVALPDPDQPAGGPDNYPTDWSVREATAIMAARMLLAGGSTPSGGQVIQERVGSYSYTQRPATSTGHPAGIDWVLNDLIGGYLCPGVYGPSQTDIYPFREENLPEVLTS